MKGWLRLGVVVSCIWLAAVCIWAIVEFAGRNPDACRLADAFLDAREIFFDCNGFADLVPGAIDRFLLEFRAARFATVALGPVVVAWTVATVLVVSGKWVIRGFKE
jgi:hypothetical protein